MPHLRRALDPCQHEAAHHAASRVGDRESWHAGLPTRRSDGAPHATVHPMESSFVVDKLVLRSSTSTSRRACDQAPTAESKDLPVGLPGAVLVSLAAEQQIEVHSSDGALPPKRPQSSPL